MTGVGDHLTVISQIWHHESMETSTANLNLMHCRTGNQWRCLITGVSGVMWSHQRMPVMSHTATFRTDCKCQLNIVCLASVASQGTCWVTAGTGLVVTALCRMKKCYGCGWRDFTWRTSVRCLLLPAMICRPYHAWLQRFELTFCLSP